MGSPVDTAVKEVQAELTALHCCPVMQKAWKARFSSSTHCNITVFCAHSCPRLNRVPDDCPEVKGRRMDVCVVWKLGALAPNGKCERECPCLQPADDEWNAAYAKWEKEQATPHERRTKPIWDYTCYDPNVQQL